MEFVVPASQAVPLRRPAGSNVSIFNQSATDVYFESRSVPSSLDSTVAGQVPRGTKLAANTGQVQFTSFPGVIWFRAAADTTVRVEP